MIVQRSKILVADAVTLTCFKGHNLTNTFLKRNQIFLVKSLLLNWVESPNNFPYICSNFRPPDQDSNMASAAVKPEGFSSAALHSSY